MLAADSENRRISYREFHELTSAVCQKIIGDSYRPDCLIGIGNGGLLPARLAKTFLEKGFGIKLLPLYVVGFSNYDKDNVRLPEPIMTQALSQDLEKKMRGMRILVVDEVDHTRATLEKVADYLLGLGAGELRVLVLTSKKCRKEGLLPDNVRIYSAEETGGDVWIDYQWEFAELFE